MTHEFQTVAPQLVAGHHLVIPIIPGQKRPALKERWQDLRITSANLAKALDNFGRCGVGLLCGVGEYPLSAIDIDTTDEHLAEAFADWCHLHLGVTVERIGQAPKRLLVYRAAEAGWGKTTGAWFLDAAGVKHRLEILGRGQQFVAYAVHPETGQPYQWVDLLGGLSAVPAEQLPEVTAEQIQEAAAAFDRLAQAHGLTRVEGGLTRVAQTKVDPEDPFANYEPPLELNDDELRAAFEQLSNADYDTWLRVGMALHHETGGEPRGLDLWNEWSENADNYAGIDDLTHRWAGFGQGGGAPITARWLLKAARVAQAEAEHATRRQTRTRIRAAISACQEPLELINKVAQEAGHAADGDPILAAEFAVLIKQAYKELSDAALPIAQIRQAMQPKAMRPARYQRRQLTEFGNAERLLDRFGQSLMYVPELEAWHSWSGTVWRRAAQVEIEHLAQETVRHLPEELAELKESEREGFYKFSAASQKAIMVRNMVSLAAANPRVVVPVAELDRNLDLLGVANGAVDLTTGTLLPPDPSHRITVVSDVVYDEQAVCPLFESTVADVFHGEPQAVAFFQRLVGYALLGRPTEDILVIPYGSGANGKSTVLGAIREALGAHAKMAGADTFLAKGGQGAGAAGGAREDVLRLRGARFVYVSEPDEGSELREGMIKAMTGGDPIPARGLYARSTVEVLPTWTVFMPTNHRPVIKGDDYAIWRRLLPVPFTRNFDKDLDVVRDPKRDEKLRKELPGILRWCVDGALAYRQHGLQLTDAVQSAREDYKADMDLLRDWLDACCELGDRHMSSTAQLWASWEAWARDHGELSYIRSSRALAKRLAARFDPYRNMREKGFKGLRVRAVGDFT